MKKIILPIFIYVFLSHNAYSTTNFRVYFFSHDKIEDTTENNLKKALESIYGATNIVKNQEQDACLFAMQDFASKKNKVFCENILCFSIRPPLDLDSGEMNDHKLTVEEYKIRDYFNSEKITEETAFQLFPIEGVDRESHGHGMWGQQIALIGFYK